MRWACLTYLLVIASSCGAPTENAADVDAIFDGQKTDLDAKIFSLCETLQNNSEGPTLEGMQIDLFGCENAGRLAQNYRTMKAFYFAGLDGSRGQKDNDVVTLNTRSQVWLGDGLLGLAARLSKSFIQAKEAESPEQEKLNPASGLSGIVKPEIGVSEPLFNEEAMRFSLQVSLELTGFVTVSQNLAIAGQMIDNAAVITIKSTRKPSYKKSLIRSLEAVVMIVPHAGDVYVDLFVHAQVYRLGFTDNVLLDQFESFLGSGMKTGLDTVLTL